MSTLDPDAHIEVGPASDDFVRHPSLLVPWSKDMTWSIFWAMARHPFKRGIVADAYNQHGVPVSVQRCRACLRRTWWTPAIESDLWKFNDVCLADYCPSYDPHRDVSFLFAPEGDNEESADR